MPDEAAFWGAHENSLDDKGRLLLPAAFRRSQGGKVVLACGADGAVIAHPSEVWAELLAQVRGAVAGADAPALRRMLGSFVEVQPDSTSRLVVPEYLRLYAGLGAPCKALIIGLGRRFEIWDRARFATYGQSAFGADLVRTGASGPASELVW